MPYTPDTFVNYAVSSVAGGAGGAGSALNASDTTLLLPSGAGASYPSSGPFMLLLGVLTGVYELAKCTARSSDTLTLVRAQEGTTALTWAYGTSVQQVASAGNLSNLWTAINQGRQFHVLDYGALCNGTHDDTAAVQATITACQNAGGGQVILDGACGISASITITADNVQIVGKGRDSQLIALSGFTSSAPMIWYKAPVSSFRMGAVLRDFVLINTVTSSAIGVQFDSTYYAIVERVDIEGVYAENIYLNGTSGQVGAYTHIAQCHIGAVNGGATSGGFGILTNNHEFNTIEACVFNWFALSTGRAIKLQNDNNVVMGCTFDECDTSIDIAFQPRNTIIGNQFDRGLTRYLYLEGAAQSVITGNVFGGQGSGATGTKIIEVSGSGNGGNIIAHNMMQSGTTGWTSFYTEDSGVGGTPPNLITANQTQGLSISLVTGVARGNPGYNPVGQVSAPAFPATTVGVTNSSGVDVTAYIANGAGAISAVQIAGANGTYNATGLQIAASGFGNVRVPAGGSVKFTYASGSPTWTWFGD